jgi:hypothetical protein
MRRQRRKVWWPLSSGPTCNDPKKPGEHAREPGKDPLETIVSSRRRSCMVKRNRRVAAHGRPVAAPSGESIEGCA